jgi:hypothetical protein
MRKGVIFGAVIVTSFLLFTSARAEPRDYLGEWVNKDPSTRGLTRLRIFREGSGWKIQAWGRCSPEDCDWKAVDLHELGSSVMDYSFKYGFAVWEAGFPTEYMTLSKDGEFLLVELVTIFRAGDGRSNTMRSERMRRVGQESVKNTKTIQISPEDGIVFEHYPRTTTLEWMSVPGAKSYTVEVDCYHCCIRSRWCADIGEKYRVEKNLTATSYTFNFVGAQPGRWRVTAVGESGRTIIQTDWWEFRYTR